MADYTLDKYDFKKYLLTTLPDTRQEELIFWKKNIPMPVDLIYTLFEKRGVLLAAYLNHIGAACLYAYACKDQGKDWINEIGMQPNAGNLNHLGSITSLFKDHLYSSGIGKLLIDLAELLLLENYFPDEKALAIAICHKGRNYKRLFIPAHFREKIKRVFPEILDHIAKSNWDMFSNVVADELKVYRMGFADGFVGIFNSLIELMLINSSTVKKGFSSAAGFKIIHNRGSQKSASGVVYGVVTDGSIWEPVYSDGRTTFVLNQMHPFCDQLRKKGSEAEAIVCQLLSVFAERENQIIRDSEKRIIEIFRQDISRELRLKSENLSE